MYKAVLIDVSVDIALDVAAHDCATLWVHSVSTAQQSFSLANVLQGVLQLQISTKSATVLSRQAKQDKRVTRQYNRL